MVETAVILAGGYGTRLQSVVSDLPKPMAPVNGQPFLNYQLRYLRHYGIKKAILSVGYLHEKITAYYKSSFEGIQISYVTEKEPLGTGGGVRLGMENCNDELALVLNGDSFFDVDLSVFYSLHTGANSKVSLALRNVDDAARYGTIITEKSNRVVSFREKSGRSEPGTINAGIYLLDKKTFLANTPAETNFSIERDFFEKKIKVLDVKGFGFDGYFIDIGIPEDFTKAQDEFKGFKYR